MKILSGYDKRKNNVIVSVVVLFAVMLASLSLVAINAVTDYVSATTNSNVTSALTPDQLAAGGPLPGNLSLIESGQECIKSLQNETTWAPWYPTMANTEHGGSERAAVFECAHFGGSFTEPNQVYAYQSPDSLGGMRNTIGIRPDFDASKNTVIVKFNPQPVGFNSAGQYVVVVGTFGSAHNLSSSTRFAGNIKYGFILFGE